MIELTYFSEVTNQVFQVVQFRRKDPWQILEGDEVVATLEHLGEGWKFEQFGVVPAGMEPGVIQLIQKQNFNFLPGLIKSRWEDWVAEVVGVSDSEYLVICRSNVDLNRFYKIFAGSIGMLVKDEWRIVFKIYDAGMEKDFEVVIN